MSRLIFEEEYIIVVPSFNDVKPHRHDFYHLFFLEKEGGQEIYVTGSKMLHTMPPLTECRLFLIIDPTSDLAGYLHEHFLMDGTPERIRAEKLFVFAERSYFEERQDEEIRLDVRSWLSDAGFLTGRASSDDGDTSENEDAVEDYRVVRLLRDIREYRHLEKKVEEIAQEYGLSESRLSHVFKEKTGIALKGYLTIAQLKYAYRLVLEGKSKTYAALEAGFASPAHLAYICKKQMGISISDVLR